MARARGPLTVDASDFARAATALTDANFERVAGPPVAKAIRKSGNLVRRNVRRKARPHRKTGHLSNSITARYRGAGLAFQGRVHAGGPIAHLITGGVKPHREEIETKRAMTIAGPGRLATVAGFATRVQHPGFAGDPFFDEGVKDSEREIQSILNDAAAQMARTLATRMDGKH